MLSVASTRAHWAYKFRLGLSSLLCGKTVWKSPRQKTSCHRLSAFLRDDKFRLPKIQSLFVHIRDVKVFSKFDLKAGFWQLGIHPVDRHKTAFCIPSGHYQWKVMPFGLKVAPSLFQKAMIKIFEPILHHALIYIDDVLLFSNDHNSHQDLLSHFLKIVDSRGIMLSDKKSILG